MRYPPGCRGNCSCVLREQGGGVCCNFLWRDRHAVMGHPVESSKRKIGSAGRLLPATREVLTEHLRAQIRTARPGLENALAAEITRGASDEDIIGLLCDSKLLHSKLEDALREKIRPGGKKPDSIADDREELGEQLFLRVAAIDSELCAQITGMLLELDSSEIRRLLDRHSELTVAVAKAKVEYVRYMQGMEVAASTLSSEEVMLDTGRTQEVIGEILYGIIAKEHPNEAPQITGMLLEMNCIDLQRLLDSPPALREKISLALEALHSV